MTTKIYGLYDENDNLRYVGKTKFKLDKRLNEHIYSAPKFKNHKDNWINSMTSRGLSPVIKELATTNDDGNLYEIFYICLFKSLGAHLTNIASGGGFGTTTAMAQKAWATLRARGLEDAMRKKQRDTRRRNGNYGLSQESIKKMLDSRRKNGNLGLTSEMVRRGIETKRRKGIPLNTPEAARKAWDTRRLKGTDKTFAKGWETRRRNGTAKWPHNR